MVVRFTPARRAASLMLTFMCAPPLTQTVTLLQVWDSTGAVTGENYMSARQHWSFRVLLLRVGDRRTRYWRITRGLGGCAPRRRRRSERSVERTARRSPGL